jgi:hypothetical protein
LNLGFFAASKSFFRKGWPNFSKEKYFWGKFHHLLTEFLVQG